MGSISNLSIVYYGLVVINLDWDNSVYTVASSIQNKIIPYWQKSI